MTIGFPLFTVTRLKETPPSAAPAGTAVTPVNTATAPAATAVLLIAQPIVVFSIYKPSSPRTPDGTYAHRPEDHPQRPTVGQRRALRGCTRCGNGLITTAPPRPGS
ncbi:hypothetical protein GFH48_01265 [Streptomyces fagopyri]|uniref:Uncharacterized protein n=1 Tax=Streptomyces fagopyri TaxID=2662397 RepID=A0A5Q0L5M4_9ACTN|nr:hypothetical protein GFH48_01265 [Streptomyces fagopyri]